jgi:flagellar biosynthesis/type III secretory pathway protein FliH
MNYSKFLFPSLNSVAQHDQEVESALVPIANLHEEEEKEKLASVYGAGYEAGYLACKKEYEQRINLESLNLMEMLRSALLLPSFFENYLEQVLSYNLQILKRVAGLICVELPSNLHLVLEQLFCSLRTIYKEGRVRIEVNSDYYIILVDLIAKLPNDSLKNAIDVVESPQIGKNFCKAYYASTIFSYDREKITQEVEQVIRSSAVSSLKKEEF